MTNLYEKIASIDSRVKFLFFFSSILLLLSDYLYLILIVTLVSLMMFFLVKVHKSIYFKAFKYILMSMIIYSLTVYFIIHDVKIFDIFLFNIRLLGMSTACMAFFVMTRPFEIIQVLRYLKIPEGLTLALGIGFRFIPIILEELNIIITAQKARGMFVTRDFNSLRNISLFIFSVTVSLPHLILIKGLNTWYTLNLRAFSLNSKQSEFHYQHTFLNYIVLLYSLCLVFIYLFQII